MTDKNDAPKSVHIKVFEESNGSESYMLTYKTDKDAIEYILKSKDVKAVNEKLVRAKTLLIATSDLLELQKDTEDALDLLEEYVRYDDADCDGHSLHEDIQKLIESME